MRIRETTFSCIVHSSFRHELTIFSETQNVTKLSSFTRENKEECNYKSMYKAILKIEATK